MMKGIDNTQDMTYEMANETKEIPMNPPTIMQLGVQANIIVPPYYNQPYQEPQPPVIIQSTPPPCYQEETHHTPPSNGSFVVNGVSYA